MESLIAKALESKLKYWLRSFSRDQFKLQGRNVQLHNLDVNGDVLHATIGLPPSLRVTQARVGKLEIKLPYFSNVKTEPIVIAIDKLDLVLVETGPDDGSSSGVQSNTTAKSTGYGFADQIADGMTIEVGVVNLMVETRGGTRSKEGAIWTPPLASFTMHKLTLYTTNENWKVVNLKESRKFSSNKRCIYIFKKLEWESLSVDLLPHPDMFLDERLTSPPRGSSEPDNDGARRAFFGGERFLDNVTGGACITMHRTEQNNPLGLEVDFHVQEALCPALSEPGLRAFLRFMTGMYVCLNRGDLDPKTVQTAEEVGRTYITVTVEHMFLCIKDAGLRIELLVQSLLYMRASNPDGNCMKTMVQICLGSLFLRDNFANPPCTLIQPSMYCSEKMAFPVPGFANEKLWPRIYPLHEQAVPRSESPSMLHIYATQLVPVPVPPALATQTIIQCQPLKINLQERSCLQIASFLADSIVVEPGVVLPDSSLNSTYFSLKEFDLTIPLSTTEIGINNKALTKEDIFTGARLHVEGFMFAESPSLTFRLLQLDKDPACFAFWKGQPADASQRRWVTRATHLSVALETGSCDDSSQNVIASNWAFGLWRCIEIHEPSLEIAMVTSDGLPLLTVPPPAGIVRLGISAKQFISNSSSEQLIFVLKLYEYGGQVSEALMRINKGEVSKSCENNVSGSGITKSRSFAGLIDLAPSDSAVCLSVDNLEFRLLESLAGCQVTEGCPLMQMLSSGLSSKVTHRTLGGAIAISSSLCWQSIRLECVETDTDYPRDNGDKMRAVFWSQSGLREMNHADGMRVNSRSQQLPFLEVNIVNVVPYKAEDTECSLRVVAKIAGVRLGGGMVYAETLLYRFGILETDGEPGKEINRILQTLSSGPLAELFKPASKTIPGPGSDDMGGSWDFRAPDSIDLDVQLIDWLFALQGYDTLDAQIKEDNCWHSTFKCLGISAIKEEGYGKQNISTHPLQKIKAEIKGFQVLKPRSDSDPPPVDLGHLMGNGYDRCLDDHSMVTGSINIDTHGRSEENGGLDLAIDLVLQEEDSADHHKGEWAIENIRAAVTDPVEMQATKSEVEYLVDIMKAEVEAASRTAAGILKLLQLQESIGQAAIDQLSNLGSGDLDRYITSDKARRLSINSRRLSVSSRRVSISSVSCTPLPEHETESPSSTIVRLEEVVCLSEGLCNGLKSEFAGEKALKDISHLAGKLQEMKCLIASLKQGYY